MRCFTVEELSAGVVARTVCIMAASNCSVDGSTSPANSPTISQGFDVRRQSIVTGRQVVSWFVVVRSQQSSCLAVVPTITIEVAEVEL